MKHAQKVLPAGYTYKFVVYSFFVDIGRITSSEADKFKQSRYRRAFILGQCQGQSAVGGLSSLFKSLS